MVYVQRMNHWPREMTKRLHSVEESSKKNKNDPYFTGENEGEKIEEKLESGMNTNEDTIFEEMREQKRKRRVLLCMVSRSLMRRQRVARREWSETRTR
jgi:hypothetical protein